MTYQFSHIFDFYIWSKRLAYAYNRIELGDAYDKYADIYYTQSIEKEN